MSTWRQTAIEMLPGHRELIERSENVGMLWTDLWFIFVKAHHPPADGTTIKATYEFARWCVAESGNADIASWTVCHFYEDLPTEQLVRSELPNFMTREHFLEMAGTFKYHLSPEEHEAFLHEFLQQRERVLQNALRPARR